MQLRYVSASQIVTFRRCKRKWAQRYLSKIRFPETAAMLRGTNIHSGIERFLLHDKPVTSELSWTAPYVEVAKQHYPPPKSPGIFIEHKFEIPTFPGGPVMLGYIDFLSIEPPKVSDTKTRSDLKYAHTPEQIREDVQLNIYAKYAYDEGLQDRIEIGHVYIEFRSPPPKTVPPRTRHVKAIVDHDHVMGIWDSVIDTVYEMVEVADGFEDVYQGNSQLIAPNTDACGDYGGCEYQNLCGVAQLPVSGAFLNKKKTKQQGEETVSFMDRLREKNAKAAEAKTKTKVKTKAKVQEEEIDEDDDDEEEVAPKKKPAFMKSKSQGAPKKKKPVPQTDSIHPADGAPRGGVTVDDGEDDENEADESIEETVSAPEAAPKRRRGRPKKAAQEGSTEAPVRRSSNGAKSNGGLVLYIDCLPLPTKSQEDVVLYEDWLVPIEVELNEYAQTRDKVHYRMLDYSEEKVSFASALQDALKNNNPGAIVISSKTPYAGEALAVLIPHARHVVRAL